MGKKTRNAALVFAIVTLVEGVLWYFMPIYFDSKLDNLLLVSVAISAHPIACLIASMPAGDICDKLGRKFTFMIGLIGFAFASLFLLIGNFPAFFMFMIMYGVFSTFYGVSAFASVMEHSKTYLAGEAAGIFTSMQYAGWLFGSLIGGVVGPITIGVALTLSSMSNLFYFTFALFVISIAMLMSMKNLQLCK